MELNFGSRTSGGRISVDWALLLASALTAALILGTIIRTGPEPRPEATARAGGLPVLADNERLISFEDFSFGTRGWNAVVPPSPAGAFASVLGPFRADAATRRYALPAGTERVELAFDLRLMGDWDGEGMTVSVNGIAVVEDLSPADGPNEVVVTPGSGAGEHRVWVAVHRPGETLSLRLEAAHRNAAWAVDNVSVVVSPDR
jgi:hypothetical protein